MQFNILGEVAYTETVSAGTAMTWDLDADGAAPGLYIVTTNTGGWNFAHTVTEQFIYDTGATELDAEDYIISVGETGEIVIEIGEDSEGLITITDGETALFTDELYNGLSDFVFDYEGLEEGIHTINVSAEDIMGQSSSITFEIVVNDVPTFTLKDLGNTAIKWNVTDGSVSADSYYEILKDDTLLSNGTWVSGTDYTIDTSSWAEGAYFLEFMVDDGFGEMDSFMVYVAIVKGPETTVTETCTDTDTTTTDEEGGGVPGFTAGMLILASLGAAALLIRKSKRS